MNEKQILVIPTSKFKELKGMVNLSTFRDIVNTHGVFYSREKAETDENYLQIIPYVVIYRYDQSTKSNKVFCYQRLKGGNEARLHAKYSVGIGGHVDKGDYTDTKSKWDHVIESSLREIKEEVKGNVLEPKVFPTNFLIYDDTNEVGRVHLGLLMTAWAYDDNIEAAEKEKIEGRMMNIYEIKQLDRERIENWSKEALSTCFLLSN